MTDYMPKVGDKVRATLGESVVVGEVVVIATHELMDIALGDPRDSVVRVFEVDGWHFEQVITVPSKFGAVIRRADGKVYSHSGLHHERPWMPNAPEFAVSGEAATAGGFTIEFDGVDE